MELNNTGNKNSNCIQNLQWNTKYVHTVISMCSLLITGNRKPIGKLYLYKAYCTINYHCKKLLFYEWWISALSAVSWNVKKKLPSVAALLLCYHISDNVSWLRRQLVCVGGWQDMKGVLERTLALQVTFHQYPASLKYRWVKERPSFLCCCSTILMGEGTVCHSI